jgi:hypothetical protein
MGGLKPIAMRRSCQSGTDILKPFSSLFPSPRSTEDDLHIIIIFGGWRASIYTIYG